MERCCAVHGSTASGTTPAIAKKNGLRRIFHPSIHAEAAPLAGREGRYPTNGTHYLPPMGKVTSSQRQHPCSFRSPLGSTSRSHSQPFPSLSLTYFRGRPGYSGS